MYSAPAGPARAGPDPLPGTDDDPLARPHIEHAAIMLDPQQAPQDQDVFVEPGRRGLLRLGPAAGAPHVGELKVRLSGSGREHVGVAESWPAARLVDVGRPADQFRHGIRS